MSSRRVFLKSSALAMFGVGSVPTWLTRAVFAKDAPGERKKILIAIFQRGAVDGLNVVVPHGEAAYYSMRPSIAIPRPSGNENSAIDLDGRFGLHPALRSLKPLWDQKQLAIVEAVGSPDPTRSHFDAQDYMESGTPGLKATSDGWLNRALGRETDRSVLRAISVGPDLPRSLRGKNEALALNSIGDFQVKDAHASSIFESLYGTSTDRVLNGTARETFDAVRVMQSIAKNTYVPTNGAQYPNGRLGQSLLQIARVIKANVGLEVAFTDVGGWDTHVNEVGPQPHLGQLANLLRDFGDSIAAFSQDMGDRMVDITLVTMSEFGRTVAGKWKPRNRSWARQLHVRARRTGKRWLRTWRMAGTRNRTTVRRTRSQGHDRFPDCSVTDRLAPTWEPRTRNCFPGFPSCAGLL